MARPKLVSLFSGTGALDLAVSAATGSVTVAVADVCGDPTTKNWPHKTPCKSPCTILAHRFPGVPNLGDVSTVDWSEIEADVVCAGFPCTDVSVAGRRAGLKPGTRTGLWSEVVRAIHELQPRLVVLENVPGIFTAPAAGDVEPCAWCLGDGADSHLRALHAVLADLATLRFDAEWVSLPASGVGAPHKRERWVAIAYPAGNPWRIKHGDGGNAAHTSRDRRDQGWTESTGIVGRPDASVSGGANVRLLPSPCTSDTNGAGVHGDLDLRTAVALLPTPMSERSGRNRSASSGAAVRPSLDAITELLPTPTAQDSAQSGGAVGSSNITLTDATVRQEFRGVDFGKYGPAIRRWEAITRPAPEPTRLTPRGRPKLSDLFDEWLMGLPEGWITDVPDISWNEVLKACGNGVVPQQIYAALIYLFDRLESRVAA